VTRELVALRGTRIGGRALATFRAAAAVGGFVGASAITQDGAERLLLEAALAAGLDEKTALSNIRRGLARGAASPRMLPDAEPSGARQRPLQALKPPPPHEVQSLWDAASRVTDDDEAAEWLRGRGLDPVAVELWDLARAVPDSTPLPGWARTRPGGSWIESGHRLITRTFDCRGGLFSVRARCLNAAAVPAKELSPAGCAVRGGVLADPLAVQLLAGPVPDWWRCRDIVICEGVPDFLTWASRQSEAREDGPATFGIASGAWTNEIAARIPAAVRLVIRTHNDAAGDDYAARIAGSLASRCRIYRSLPEEQP